MTTSTADILAACFGTAHVLFLHRLSLAFCHAYQCWLLVLWAWHQSTFSNWSCPYSDHYFLIPAGQLHFFPCFFQKISLWIKTNKQQIQQQTPCKKLEKNPSMKALFMLSLLSLCLGCCQALELSEKTWSKVIIPPLQFELSLLAWIGKSVLLTCYFPLLSSTV